MGGGLMQLVAYGAQDVYLTGNPQITYFKVVYRRHSNFAMESIEQTFNGNPDFGRRVTCTISRNGDLINRVYLQTSLPAVTINDPNATGFRWIDSIGHFIGQLPESLRVQRRAQPQTRLYVPLQFWFCRNPGLSLPLIALQYHEVKVNIQFNDLSNLYISDADPGPLSLPDTSLWIDYVYLDTDERRRFAQVQHEYLIEQLQYTGEESITNSSYKSRLNFNHPVKELIWTVQLDEIAETYHEWTNYTTEPCGIVDDQFLDVTVIQEHTYGGENAVNPVYAAKLQLNGHDRFQARDGKYFNLVQPYQHHTNIPDSPGINVYSFGLRPEEHQPSGTVNMSRIDNATLLLQLDPAVVNGAKLRVYALSYNVLRIMSGMGGLAYSN